MSALPAGLRIVGTRQLGTPILPDATIDYARTAPMPAAATCDVVHLLGGAPDEAAVREAMAATLGARGYRVLTVGGLERPTRESAVERGLTALKEARHQHRVETAVVIAPRSGPLATIAEQAERLWGWRRLDAHTNETEDPALAIRSAFPPATIVVVTHDNLAYLRLCLASILGNTDYPSFDVVVVDNGAAAETSGFLAEVARRHERVRVLRSERNLGFAAANNLAMRHATGDVLALLNDDVLVARGWLTRLARHAQAPEVGIVGAVTNRTCNEAQIAAPYQTFAGFERIAAARARDHDGERFALRMVAMFCVVMRRAVWERIGTLDERFAVGMFEDEDYAFRARRAGLEVVCGADVFVHHAEHASIGRLVASGDYRRVFAENRARFEEKWGVSWSPHRPRP